MSSALSEHQRVIDRLREWAVAMNPPDYTGMDENPIATGPGDKMRGYNLARHYVAFLLTTAGLMDDEVAS